MTAPALELCLALAAAQARVALAVDEDLGAWHGLAWHDLVLLIDVQRTPDGARSLVQTAVRQGLAPAVLLRRLLPMEKTGWIERRGGQLALRPAGERLAREAAASAELAARRALQGLPASAWPGLHERLAPLAADAAAVPAGEAAR